MPDVSAALAALTLLVPAAPGESPAPTRDGHPPLAHFADIQLLGSLGGSYTEARGVNDAGQIVGFSFDAHGRRRAFFWDAGTGIIDLNNYLSGSDASQWTLRSAEAINNTGQIVGTGWRVTSAQTITAAFSLTLPNRVFCPADRTGPAGYPDGYVNIADLNDFLESYAIESAPGYTGPLTCDYAGPAGPSPDGRVSIHDLNYYISIWVVSQGPCN
ncbi:MAG: hypothetical protein EA378_02495 [Phycisphaerales bacterium]|nr:MAG: hypothetical protein EA378_02495 [Phycisphaerales bacterium]